ncbi:amino acid adenylation domain-containing protein, partial [Pseudomonas sp. LARHCG127]
VPLGVPGEIYIGGAGVARGYLNRDDLTAERFLKDPFSNVPNARMYKTGDLGRYLPDGNIEYLGRNDDQVKIRGFRIELGEIEAKLSQHEALNETVVLAREDVPGDKRLVAYFTQHSSGEVLDIEALRAHLQAQLPAYMVPVAYVRLDALPLTPNGKLDRKALPAPDLDAVISRGYEAPQGAVETTLAQIWQDLLGLQQVGRHDHFFELGGHSLLAVSLIERMRQAGLSTDVRILFGQPTLAALAATVGGSKDIVVPVNRIALDCTRITPDMLTLTSLDQDAIDRIVSTVPGGARNVQDIYPLAPLQEGILYHHLAAEQGDPYVLQTQFAFDNRERLDAFTQALQGVIDRHDILRSSMAWEGLDEPVQVVWRQAVLGVEHVLPQHEDGDVLSQLKASFDVSHHRLDIRQAPLMRVRFAQDAINQRWVAILLFHHMALDHTALEVVRHEMQAHLLGHADQLGAAVPYRNYVAQVCLGVSREEHEGFFRAMLGDVDEPTLPFGLQDVFGDGSGIEEARQAIATDLSRRLRTQARRLGVSAAALHHLAWAQVLGRVSGREDVVFGTVLMGRMQGGEGADRALGMFINTLPIGVQVGAQSVRAGVLATHARLTGLLGHEHASLALAQRCSGVMAPTPLFSALLNYRHSVAEPIALRTSSAWQGIEALGSEERTNYPLTMSVDDLGEDFSLTVLVESRIGAQRICGYMQVALESLVDALEHAPQTPLHSLAILPPAERKQLLETWNATGATYTHDLLIHRQFEAQAAANPQAVAVVYADQALTYGELDARANQLAHHLLALGVRPDDRVAICVERSLEMVVGLLGVLKAGAGYVPVDPAYPAERIAYLLQDSAPVAVLAQTVTQGSLAAGSVPVINLDSGDWQDESVSSPEVPGLEAHHLAYVIYTSGSTGLPKGVMVEHRNLSNLVGWHCQAFDVKRGSRTSSVAGFGFDAAAWEIWPSLCAGATLLLPPAQAGSEDVGALLDWWQAQALDVCFLPTPIAEYAFGRNLGHDQLRTLLIGGDRLRKLPADLPFELINNYGPTETTVVATSGRIDASQAVLHIGRPVANTQVYLLDAHLQPVPVGVAGELYIGGAGVARGYLNRAQLTAERFVKDPFSAMQEARMYRTGDLGRYLPDGNIDYLGRNDSQLKIRGLRIELGEIEARLGACAGVREAVVVAVGEAPDDQRLVAYYTAHDSLDQGLTADNLREQLQVHLPGHMVPAAYMRLDALPLTPNGKLDRRALPVPDSDAYSGRGYEAPQGEVETALARIWSELLKVEQVGRYDNFFELGGHSLMAVSLIERMRQVGLSADVRVLFSQPTLAALAAAVGSGSEVSVPANLIPLDCEHITPAMLPLVALDPHAIERIVSTVPGGARNVQDIYPLAPLQEGILYHHLSAEQGDPYLLQTLFAFETHGRLEDFSRALQQVIDRHDILRTSIRWEGFEQPLQIVWRKAQLRRQEVALDPVDGDAATQLHERFDSRHHRLDITQAPMLRLVHAYDTDNDRWLAMLLFHHMTLDHTALEVLQHEIQACFSGEVEQLGAAVPYRNYVAQARLGVSSDAHEGFFRDMLSDVDEPTLPFELQDVQGDGSGIEEVRQDVEPGLSRRLRAQARQLGVSAASLYHLVWAQVLGKVSGKDDVVFGTVLMGRMQGGEGADRALGMFINTLPLRVSVAQASIRAGVKATHVQLTALLGHEHASLALAQRCSGVQAPTPLFSALLNYRHTGATTAIELLPAWNGIQVLSSEERTNYPLTLSVDDQGEAFSFTVMTPARIGAQRLCGYVRHTLENLVHMLEQQPDRPLQQLSILPASEREQLLVAFNATEANYPQQQTIHGLFEEQVQRTSEAVAVICGEQRLSYGDLNERANRLAHYLRKQGVQPDSRVAICVERGIDMVVGLLAILKAGGGYVPLDPAYPLDRIAYMLEDSVPAAVLAQTATLELLAAASMPVINLDSGLWQDESVLNPEIAALTSSHLAYVIYTSGSTGLPKGVMIEHRNTVNFLTWAHRSFDDATLSKTLFSTSLNFDLAVYECFAPLTSGGSINVVTNVLELQQGEHDITLINTVPSALKALLESGGLGEGVDTV